MSPEAAGPPVSKDVFYVFYHGYKTCMQRAQMQSHFQQQQRSQPSFQNSLDGSAQFEGNMDIL